VSLACVGAHRIWPLRTDGKVTHNIEATRTGVGGFHSHPDQLLPGTTGPPTGGGAAEGRGLRLRPCGALTPRRMLGVFVGSRARYYQDTGTIRRRRGRLPAGAELIPAQPQLHFAQLMVSLLNGLHLFEEWERGHPVGMATILQEVLRAAPA